MTSTVDSLLSNLVQIESSQVVTEAVNNELLKQVTSLDLEVVGISSSVDNKNLQYTV